MIDAIVYSSLSGSCEEYAHRMSAALHVPFFTEQSHICPTGRKVVYIGWLLAGKVVGLDKAKERYNVVGVVSVGMGAPAANAEEVCRKKNGLGADVAVFPLQGRFDLKRLPLPYRLIMKVKIKDIAKRLNAKAAKTTLTPAEQACLTMATVGRGEPPGTASKPPSTGSRPTASTPSSRSRRSAEHHILTLCVPPDGNVRRNFFVRKKPLPGRAAAFSHFFFFLFFCPASAASDGPVSVLLSPPPMWSTIRIMAPSSAGTR